MQKMAPIALVVAAITSVPVMVLSSFGDRLSKLDEDMLGVGTVSFAGLGKPETAKWTGMKNSTCLGTVDDPCPHQTIALPGMSDQLLDFIFLYCSVFQVIAGAALLALVIEWRWAVTVDIRREPWRHPRVAQYSVIAQGLHPSTTAQEVAEHFDRLADLSSAASSTAGRRRCPCCAAPARHAFDPQNTAQLSLATLQRRPRGTLNPTAEVASQFCGSGAAGKWVADVQIVPLSPALSTHYASMVAMKRERDRLVADCLKYSDSSPEADSERAIAAQDQLADCDLALQELDSATPSLPHSAQAGAAFITFNNEESWQRVVEDYSSSTCALCCCRGVSCGSSQGLLLKGRRVAVAPAPHPESVSWSALFQSDEHNFKACTLVGLVGCLVLCLLAALHVIAGQGFIQAAGQSPPGGVCEYVAPAAAFGTTAFPPDARLQQVPRQQCNSSNLVSLAWGQASLENNLGQGGWTADPCFGVCLDPANSQKLCNAQPHLQAPQQVHSAASNVDQRGYSQEDLVQCYCRQEAEALVAAWGFELGLARLTSASSAGAVCSSFAERAQVLRLFPWSYAVLSAVTAMLLPHMSAAIASSAQHVSRSDAAFTQWWLTQVFLLANAIVFPLFVFLQSHLSAPVEASLGVKLVS